MKNKIIMMIILVLGLVLYNFYNYVIYNKTLEGGNETSANTQFFSKEFGRPKSIKYIGSKIEKKVFQQGETKYEELLKELDDSVKIEKYDSYFNMSEKELKKIKEEKYIILEYDEKKDEYLYIIIPMSKEKEEIIYCNLNKQINMIGNKIIVAELLKVIEKFL